MKEKREETEKSEFFFSIFIISLLECTISFSVCMNKKKEETWLRPKITRETE